MSTWNYKDVGAPKLTPEFRDNYIINIGKAEAVTAVGLLVLGHEKGMKSLTTKVLELPSKENNWTCIVQAELVGYGHDPITGETIEVTYSAIGDANVGNCGKMVAPSYIRMAETRSVGRVLRNYTNIGMLCSDEVGNSVEIHTEMINTNQVQMIAALMKSKAVTKEKGREIMKKITYKTTMSALTLEEGNNLIQAFKKLPTPQEEAV